MRNWPIPRSTAGGNVTNSRSEKHLQAVVQHQERNDDDARELHDGNLIARSGHASQAAGGALNAGRHGGEGVGL